MFMKKLLFVALSLLAVSSSYAGKRRVVPCPAGYQAGLAQCPDGQVAIGMRVAGSNCYKCIDAPVAPTKAIVAKEESFSGLGIAKAGDGNCPDGWHIINTRLGRKQGYRHTCIKPQN